MTIDILLLLALPASGKSEIRRYLESLDPATAKADFGLGPSVQLDDYPYVHLMRRISEEQRLAGLEPTFFRSATSSLADGRDWGSLIHLLNQDYRALTSGWGPIGDPGNWMLTRMSKARALAGADPEFVETRHRASLAARIGPDVGRLIEERHDLRVAPGDTIVIEFARGGPQGSPLPIPPPHGYAHSLAQLSDEILGRSSIVYVWVTPEESRRRNQERAQPGGESSILHHGVPEEVMFGDYGCDDIEWLVERSSRPGTIEIGVHQIPLARFDNRIDKTSFLRGEEWPPDLVGELHAGLKSAFAALQSRWSR